MWPACHDYRLFACRVTIPGVSDVWQGPGWWLASDGKWYPADAKPGDVYEGTIETGSPATVSGAVDPIAATNGVTTLDTPAVEHNGAFADVDLPVAETPFSPVEPIPSVVDDANATMPTPSDVDTDASDNPTPTTIGNEFAAPIADTPAVDLPPEPTTAFDAAVSEAAAPTVEVPEFDVSEGEATDIGVPPVEPPQFEAPEQAIPEVEVPTEIPVAPDADDFFEPDLPTDSTPFFEPEPVGESADGGGGWQAIVDTPDTSVVEPPPLDTTAITPPPGTEVPTLAQPIAAADADDGWTSAYEEMHHGETTPDADTGLATSDLTGEATPSMTADEAFSQLAPETPAIDAVPEIEAATLTTTSVADTVPDIAPPAAAPVPDVPAPAGEGLSAPAGSPAIARDDAWRKPSESGATFTGLAPAPERNEAPEVVDLAIPDTSPLREDPPVEKRRSRNLIKAILALAIIVGVALLLAWVLRPSADDSASEPEPTTSDDVATTLPTTAPTETADDDSLVSVFDLRAGACIVGDISSGEVTQVEIVDCDQEHQFEVYREALIDSSIATYDEAAIATYAEEICRTSLAAYIPADDDRDLKFKFLQPTEESWGNESNPDRVVTCLLFDEEGPLVGRAGP